MELVKGYGKPTKGPDFIKNIQILHIIPFDSAPSAPSAPASHFDCAPSAPSAPASHFDSCFVGLTRVSHSSNIRPAGHDPP